MILDSIGEGLLDQNTLYTSNHSHSQPGWATDPDGLCYTLNDNNTNPKVPGFLVYKFDIEHDLTWRVIFTLYHYKVPVASLVFGCGHWIVVKGYSTDVDPQKTNNYTLNGLYIDNPWPPSPGFYNPAVTPPPHNVNDGCGTGGDRGVASEYVTYDSWKSTYMTGCDVWHVGHNQFVSVCDPDILKLGKIIMRRDIFKKDDELIKGEEIHEILSKGIELHELSENELFAEALKNSVQAEPILVQRLDKNDTYYYLVPIERDNKVTAVMSVNGITGSFQGGRIVTAEKGRYVVKKKEILNKIIMKPIQLPGREGMLKLREGTFCVHPVMVWKPCEESRSPYYPFHMITVGSKTIYIGYDGKVFTQLHDLSKGG